MNLKQELDELLSIRTSVNDATTTFEGLEDFPAKAEIVSNLDDVYNVLSYVIGLVTQS